MKTVLYSKIVLAGDLNNKTLTEAAVIQRAAKAGYALTVFNGWDNADLGFRNNPGPRRVDAEENATLLREIEELFPDGCGYSDINIIQTAPEPVVRKCERCGFEGSDWLDGGEACPECKLVQ